MLSETHRQAPVQPTPFKRDGLRAHPTMPITDYPGGLRFYKPTLSIYLERAVVVESSHAVEYERPPLLLEDCSSGLAKVTEPKKILARVTNW